MSKEGFLLSFDELNNIFPFYILLNKDLTIDKIGKSIQKIFPDHKLGNHFFDHWNVVKPQVEFDYKKDFESIIGKLTAIRYEERQSFVLKGHFEKVESKALRDFIYESNNGRLVNFVETLEIALERFTL